MNDKELVSISWGDREESEEAYTSISLGIKAINIPAFEKQLMQLKEELG